MKDPFQIGHSHLAVLWALILRGPIEDYATGRCSKMLIKEINDLSVGRVRLSTTNILKILKELDDGELIERDLRNTRTYRIASRIDPNKHRMPENPFSPAKSAPEPELEMSPQSASLASSVPALFDAEPEPRRVAVREREPVDIDFDLLMEGVESQDPVDEEPEPGHDEKLPPTEALLFAVSLITDAIAAITADEAASAAKILNEKFGGIVKLTDDVRALQTKNQELRDENEQLRAALVKAKSALRAARAR